MQDYAYNQFKRRKDNLETFRMILNDLRILGMPVVTLLKEVCDKVTTLNCSYI